MPKTASASVLPVMCAMPQSSRVMLTLRACCAQRAASAGGVAWNAKTVEAAASPIAASTSFLREWWFFMSYLPSILAHRAKARIDNHRLRFSLRLWSRGVCRNPEKFVDDRLGETGAALLYGN